MTEQITIRDDTFCECPEGYKDRTVTVFCEAHLYYFVDEYVSRN
jgi:hypothetical protein